MADTARSIGPILTLFADNTAGDISEQDLRDFVVSALGGYGALSVQDGVAAQVIGTTPAKLTAFTVAGASRDTTPAHATDDITVAVAADYWVHFSASLSGTLGRLAELRLRRNATEVTGAGVKLDLTGDIQTANFAALVTCAAADVLSIYAEADLDSTSITVTDASLVVKRCS